MYTKRPNFNTFGRFSLLKIRHHPIRLKPGKTGLLHCSPVQLRGFRNNVGAKLMDFS